MNGIVDLHHTCYWPTHLTSSDGLDCFSHCPAGEGPNANNDTCEACDDSTPLTSSDGLTCLAACPLGQESNANNNACVSESISKYKILVLTFSRAHCS